MHQVEVDVQEVWLAGRGADHVRIPQFLGQGGHREAKLYRPLAWSVRARLSKAEAWELCVSHNHTGSAWPNILGQMDKSSRVFVGLLLGLLGLIGLGTSGARAT